MSQEVQLKPINSPVIAAFAIIIGLYGFTTSNPMETAWTGFMLWFICRLFWWQHVPGIILLTLIIPFIEIHTGVLNANSANISLDAAFNGTGRRTFWLSSLGLLFVCLGLNMSLNKSQLGRVLHTDRLHKALSGVTMPRLIIIYIILNVAGELVDIAIPWNSSLKQFEVQFKSLPITALFAICIHYFLFRKNRLLFAAFLTIVFLQSLYSYFSSWKLPLEILVAVSLIQFKEFKLPQFLRLAPLFLPILIFVGIWQNIKSEYRYILSGGLENQSIQISQSEALLAAFDLASTSFETSGYADSSVVQSTYDRTGYLEYFAATLNKVPLEIPHEKGKLTFSNLEFALVPRIINPQKPLKNDRAKVEKYTGYYFGGDRAISSFSLGHYCEAFIDWGSFGMMIHLFFYGFLGGKATNLLTSRNMVQTLFGPGILFVLLSFWGTYQKDMITIVGSLLWGGMAYIVLFPLALKRLLP